MMARPDFSRRATAPELMDGEGIPFEEYHACLGELERINILTLAYRPTLRWMRRFHGEPLSVLDAGSGGGDMLRRLAAENPRLSLTGADLNPWSKKSAERREGPESAVRHETADIFSLEGGFDVVVSSLFAHHLSDGDIIRFLRWMDGAARRGWFINDLHRHPVPYYFIKWATRLFSRNRLIRHDAPASVARAFTVADWRRLLEEAGIPGNSVEIRRFFPFRICVSCVKR